jgi:hypothetical protein
MNTKMVIIVLLAVTVISATATITTLQRLHVAYAIAGSAADFTPGHEAKSPGDAQNYAPGHETKVPGPAKYFAPGWDPNR